MKVDNSYSIYLYLYAKYQQVIYNFIIKFKQRLENKSDQSITWKMLKVCKCCINILIVILTYGVKHLFNGSLCECDI